MALREFIRNSAFNLARQDLATFLEEHEEHLVEIFREEIEAVDEAIPEEKVFIDIRMVPLGEVLLEAALRSIVRFLREDQSESKSRIEVETEDSEVNLKD
jgi:hypothetical protein